jgi:tryptophan halogenase
LFVLISAFSEFLNSFGVLMQNPISRIIIVGGGTAGWMSAAALSVAVPKEVEVLLIESEEIGIIGVGEATVPAIRFFNDHIGLNEAEFVRATEATFKLGIEFRGWGHETNRYFHGFGDFGDDHQAISAYALWRRLRSLGDQTPLEAFSLSAQLALADRFFPPNPDPRSPMHNYNYAFHFDASLYARFLRRHAEARGVKRLNAKISGVNLRSEDGFIESVTLEDGRVEAADFFIDCSGFRGLLIEGALKTGYTDWSHYLPVDRAWAVPCERTDPLQPYTVSTAREAGWQWRIPLQHRTGNGHVFSSNFTDEQSALDTLMANLDGAPLKDPMLIRFTTGYRNKFWNKNCICTGLASGFIEPLESTSINFIQNLMVRFLEFYPSRSHSQAIEDEFNRMVLREYERVRDFIILHYRLNTRQDGELWRYCADMPIPDSLQARMDLFAHCGRVITEDRDTFKLPSWTAIFNGQGVVSDIYDPLADRLGEFELRSLMRQRLAEIEKVTQQLPSHAEFIARHCASEAFLKPVRAQA